MSPAPILIPELNFAGIMPAVIISVTALVIMSVGLFIKKSVIGASMVISISGVLIAAATNYPLRYSNSSAFSGLVAVDTYTWFFNLLILFAVGLTVLTSGRYLADEDAEIPEYFVLLLFSAVGMMFMVSGTHLLTIFIGLETLSISIYVLTGILPKNVKSKEAALKYLILGAFSSGLFLYGAALLYGATGSGNLSLILKALSSGTPSTMALVGMALVLVGFAFKTAAVPFHMWTPDVYEGAPTPFTGFMSVAVKAAAFAAFARVFFEALPTMKVNWTLILWLLAVLTMILGNFAALVQDNIKRMLAYSSIAHAGYILVGIIAGKEAGISGMLYYLLAYTFTNIGAFGIVTLVGRKGEANIMLDDYRGLGRSHPLLALSMSIFLFSLAGIPPTAGFVGKFTIFRAAIESGYYWLVIIGVLTSAVSVFYYFRVIMKMYMEEPQTAPAKLSFSPGMLMTLSVTVLVVLYIGIFPTRYLGIAMESVKPLFN